MLRSIRKSSATCMATATATGTSIADSGLAAIQGRQKSLHTFSDAANHLFPPVAKFNEIIADRGKGCQVWDVDNNRYLDFTSGIGVLSTGHSHPKVVNAISSQAQKIIFAQQNILPVTPVMIELIKRFKSIMPSQLTRYFFAQSGSEVVDNAIKLARAATGKQNIIAFDGAYHGRTYGAMSLTTSKTIYRQKFGPLPSGVITAAYPYCLHCPTRLASGGLDHGLCETPPVGPPYLSRACCNTALNDLRMAFKTATHPDETAAIILEPILGEGGFLVPPPGFLTSLRQICDEHNVLLIFDEVQAGMARTGTWWSHQQLHGTDEQVVQPDIMIFAKGIASGYPFAGLAAREGLFERLDPGTMGGTYGGSALGCAAAVATIDVIMEENLMNNAVERGRQLTQGLTALGATAPIAEVRGRGLMMAAELSSDVPYGTAAKVVKAAGERGVLLLTCGARETLRFLPPLVVSEEEVDEALHALKEALQEVI